ncbi:hypothetical protein [Gaetbulibacter saemankumensis]|uniref:hypothetical protein n=1 Tax=Gaetbulibacter saemankumensis TaxID=311208 RepID=UPI000402A80F|nr:hypothetical protein [Gaetbulibacter saemankumensis]
MKTKVVTPKYVEWLTAENMHQTSLEWLSELRFVYDEQLFFNDLVKSYTLQLINTKHFQESKSITDKLNILEKDTNHLIDQVVAHEKGLEIMVDSINQIAKENDYKREHNNLTNSINKFMSDYKALKTRLFALLKDVLKEGKQKHLLQ